MGNELERAKNLGYREGDLVTGVDRSYVRSIYRAVSVDYNHVKLAIYSYNGVVYNDDGKESWRSSQWEHPPGNRPEDFRLATKAEIRESETVMKREPWEG